jgi:hypothetical protein
MAKPTPARISQAEALLHLVPFMGRSSWYARPRRTMVDELDIRISPENGRVTMDRKKFFCWLDSLAGPVADRAATSDNFRPRRTSKTSKQVALESLIQAFEEGCLSEDEFREALRMLGL